MSKIKTRLLRGLLLKFVGLGAKASFILLFVPQLADGEFAKYFLAFTYVLIASRLLAMGADNYISFRVKSSFRRAAYYLSASSLYSLFAIVAIAISFAADNEYSFYLLCVALVFALSANSYQIGALRSHDNVFQERRANLPWLVVCAFVLIFGATKASEVLLYLSASYLLVGVVDFKAVKALGLGVSFPAIRPVISHARHWIYWSPISFSAIGIAASLRSFPIILDLFDYKINDTLAFNFLLGEIVYQVCMVYVNQVQSSVSRQRRFLGLSELFKVVVFFAGCSLLACLGVYLLRIAYQNPMLESLDYSLMFSVSLYCSTVAIFSFVGVFAWGSRSVRSSVVVLIAQAFSFVLCGLAMLLFNVGSIAVISVAAVNVCIVSFLCFYIRKFS
jgi:hypothetical protein